MVKPTGAPTYDGNYGWHCGFPCRGTLYAPDATGLHWCDDLEDKHAWKREGASWVLAGTASFDREAKRWTQPVATEAQG